MSYEANLPPGCSPSDIPGFDRYYPEPEPEEIEYFPVVHKEALVPDFILRFRERMDALKAAELETK